MDIGRWSATVRIAHFDFVAKSVLESLVRLHERKKIEIPVRCGINEYVHIGPRVRFVASMRAKTGSLFFSWAVTSSRRMASI
jgi:hypothetical protein